MADNIEPNEDQQQEPSLQERYDQLQAKYEDSVKHSRTWENRATSNKKKADEYDALKAEHDQAQAELAELREYKQAAEKASSRAALAKKVAEATGVPADMIAGDTEEEMRAYAERLDQWAHPKPAGMPNQGSTPQHQDKSQQQRDFLRELFSNAK